MKQAKYVRTVVGWVNVTVEGTVYNLDPASFTRITGVQADISVGCGELDRQQVAEIKQAGRFVRYDGTVEWISA